MSAAGLEVLRRHLVEELAEAFDHLDLGLVVGAPGATAYRQLNAAVLSATVVPRSEPATSAPYTPVGSRRFARRCASATVSNQPPTAPPVLTP